MNKYLLFYNEEFYKIKIVEGTLDYENICDGNNTPLIIIKLTDELIDEISKLKEA